MACPKVLVTGGSGLVGQGIRWQVWDTACAGVRLRCRTCTLAPWAGSRCPVSTPQVLRARGTRRCADEIRDRHAVAGDTPASVHAGIGAGAVGAGGTWSARGILRDRQQRPRSSLLMGVFAQVDEKNFMQNPYTTL
jgi:hypothetical protein